MRQVTWLSSMAFFKLHWVGREEIIYKKQRVECILVRELE